MRHLYQMSRTPVQLARLGREHPGGTGNQRDFRHIHLHPTGRYSCPLHLQPEQAQRKGDHRQRQGRGRDKTARLRLEQAVVGVHGCLIPCLSRDRPERIDRAQKEARFHPCRPASTNGRSTWQSSTTGHLRSGARALLFNEFTSPGLAVMEIGFSANWRMAIYLNGEQVYSTLAAGNGSYKFVPNDHVVELAIPKGPNVLAVEVLSGNKGWQFICGTPRTTDHVRGPRRVEARRHEPRPGPGRQRPGSFLPRRQAGRKARTRNDRAGRKPCLRHPQRISQSACSDSTVSPAASGTNRTTTCSAPR